MQNYNNLSDFISFNSEFRNAINIDLNLNHKEKLLSYIPTKSSVDILKTYMRAIQNNSLHTSMLIGRYGKGKSHLLLVLLAILSLDRNDPESVNLFSQLFDKINKVDSEAGNLLRSIWENEKGRFLPVIVSCQSDVIQGFLLALKKALASFGLDSISPKTDYEYAVKTIENWQQNFSETYSSFSEIIKSRKISINAFKAELLLYNKEYLGVFKEIYPQLTSGSSFNPMAEADITRLYLSVADELREKHGFRGIYIVFDEFSKFIEGQDKVSAGINMKYVQDMCEMAEDSREPEIYLTLVAHKPIKEYGNKLSQETINSFTGIEGRLDAEIPFITSSKNNYELIQNAIIKDDSCLDNLSDEVQNVYFNQNLIDSFSLPAFSSFTKEDFTRMVVRGCYPLSPVSTYLLINISEKVAQNERTLFTFISKEEKNSMAEYICRKKEYSSITDWCVTPDLIYDYFSNLFRDENDEIKEIYQKSLVALDAVLELENKEYLHKIIKTLAVITIVNNEQELPWNDDTLRLSVNMNYSNESRNMYDRLIKELFDANILDIDGKNFYRFKTVEGKELEETILARWRSVANDGRIGELFQQLFRTKYAFPKKYNYEYGITRYYRYKFIEVTDFLQLNSDRVLFDDGYFCDGKIICLYKFDLLDYEEKIKSKLQELKSHKIIVLKTDIPIEIKEDINKLQVVYSINDDYSFLSKNNHLIPEINEIIVDLETKIANVLESIYGRFGTYSIMYFCDEMLAEYKDRSLTDCIDELCYKIYDKTPVINNEFVNKQNITTGATKNARKNVMERLLTNSSVDDYLNGTSQDATIFRAMFVRTGLYNNQPEEKMNEVIEIINGYFEECIGNKLPVSELVELITAQPYGIRMGVIPVYMAYVIGKLQMEVVAYYGDKEILLNTDTLINMCMFSKEYSFFISKNDVAKETYLNELINLFEVNIDENSLEPRVNQIFSAMQKWYRALPQVTLNMKKDLEYLSEDYLVKAVQRMANILQRYEVNPYEAILYQIPVAFGVDNDYDECFQRIKKYFDVLVGYYSWNKDRAIKAVKSCFNNEDDSLYHILLDWYNSQSELAKGNISNQGISKFITVVKQICNANISDGEIADKLSKATIGVYIDYWNVGSFGRFSEELLKLKEEIESLQQDNLEDEDSNEKYMYISRDGQKYYYEISENEDSKMFKDVLEGTLEDFEGLGKNELVAVLLDQVEKILQRGND